MTRVPNAVKVPSRKTPRPGDHFRVWRGYYWHHAIYIDNGWLIEFGGGAFGGPVEYVSWGTFARGDPVERVEHARRYPPDQIVERAQSWLGMNGFSLLTNNCEHFANWCATGKIESGQARFAVGVLALLAVGLAANSPKATRVFAA